MGIWIGGLRRQVCKGSQLHCYTVLFAAAKSLQSCPTLCDPIDGSPAGSSVHGIFQARVLESGVIAFSILFCLPRHYSVNPQPTLVYFSFFSNTVLIGIWGISPLGFPCITSHLRLFTDPAASIHVPAIPLHHCFILATDSLRLNSHDFAFLKAFPELFRQLLII